MLIVFDDLVNIVVGGLKRSENACEVSLKSKKTQIEVCLVVQSHGHSENSDKRNISRVQHRKRK